MTLAGRAVGTEILESDGAILCKAKVSLRYLTGSSRSDAVGRRLETATAVVIGSNSAAACI